MHHAHVVMYIMNKGFEQAIMGHTCMYNEEEI